MTSTAEETMARLKAQAESEASGGEEAVQEEITVVEPANPKKHGESTREYVILSAFSEVARVNAASSEGALRLLAEEKELKNGTKYVVVPARNWNEHQVAVETKTTITIK